MFYRVVFCEVSILTFLYSVLLATVAYMYVCVYRQTGVLPSAAYKMFVFATDQRPWG